MKIALITDLHYGVRNDNPVFYDYFEKSMSFFFEHLEKNNIKHLVMLGDLFDRRKYLNYVTAKMCRETFLLPIEKLGINAHIIAGNHDVYYKNTNAINALDEVVAGKYKNVHVCTQLPELIMIDDLPIQLMPWINQTNAHASYTTLETTNAEIVMGHFDIIGFEMFRGMVSDHGENKSKFSRFDMVMSGHYHHKSSSENIHYLGAFMEHTWADYNDPKGFHIFDTKTRTLEFVQNPYVIFKMLSYDDVKYPDILERIIEKDYSEYKDCYVKVVCVNRTNPYAFDMLMDKLYKVGPIDISVVEDISVFTDNEEDTDIDFTQDTQTLLMTYIKGLTLSVDNSKMIDYMNDVYQEAISQEHVG